MASLEAVCRAMVPAVRAAGAALDRDPATVAGLARLPAADLLRCVATPPAYRGGCRPPDGLVLSGTSCLEWTVALEGIAYGDPAVALACPGPSLPGAAVTGLGDEDQREWFFSRLTGAQWTFFAMTEPAKGSAMTELGTRLENGRLYGEKCHVMNGARASAGVVFCRRAPGPWGIEAVLVDGAGPHAEQEHTLGLRGTGLSRIRFDGVAIPPDRVLGRHLPPLRRGFAGALRALHRCRPPVAGIALGVAEAACDYVREHRPALPSSAGLAELTGRIAAVRRLVHEAAAALDRGKGNPRRISAGKARACSLADEATRRAAELLGPASLAEYPWLERMRRDMRGFEFLEGAGDIHRLSVFQGLLTGEFLPTP